MVTLCLVGMLSFFSPVSATPCHHARFIYAGCEHDFTSMLVAFEEMGVKLNRFNPAEDMRSIRFLLRDTQSAAESKEDMARFRRRMAKRRGRELKNPVDAYPGKRGGLTFHDLIQLHC